MQAAVHLGWLTPCLGEGGTEAHHPLHLLGFVWASGHLGMAFWAGGSNPSHGQEEGKEVGEGPVSWRPQCFSHPCYWTLPWLDPQWISSHFLSKLCAFAPLHSCFAFCQKSPSFFILLVNSYSSSAMWNPAPRELLVPPTLPSLPPSGLCERI